MEFANISINIAYLAALSLAAERLTETVKGFCGKPCAKSQPVPDGATAEQYKQANADEAKRNAKISGLSIVAGILTAAVAYLIGVLPVATNWGEVFIFGVLASAGSGFWNAVLSYILQLKNTLPIKASTPEINLVMQAPAPAPQTFVLQGAPAFSSPDDGRTAAKAEEEKKLAAGMGAGR